MRVNVNQNFYIGMTLVGQWMGQILHNKGSVFVDRGLAGLDISNQIRQGFLDGLKKTGPKVKDVGEFDGGYAQGPSSRAFPACSGTSKRQRRHDAGVLHTSVHRVQERRQEAGAGYMLRL